MSKVSRRSFLRTAGAVAGSALIPETASAETRSPAEFDGNIAVLYDATKCIGCRSCVRRCREVNGLPPEEREVDGVKFDMPSRLSETNWTVLQVHREDGAGDEPGSDEPAGDGAKWSYVKKNCMHCNQPACATACPVAALTKSETGSVDYDEDRCIGCRYCLLACPYHVPRYEWVDRQPRVRKCNWNRACVDACPVGALTQGRRADMIREAHWRIRERPEVYVDHVYGEHEAGGASYLLLSGVQHAKLGLPLLPPTERSRYSDAIMKSLPGLIVGLGLFLGGLHQMDKLQRRSEEEGPEADETAEEGGNGP